MIIRLLTFACISDSTMMKCEHQDTYNINLLPGRFFFALSVNTEEIGSLSGVTLDSF